MLTADICSALPSAPKKEQGMSAAQVEELLIRAVKSEGHLKPDGQKLEKLIPGATIDQCRDAIVKLVDDHVLDFDDRFQLTLVAE